MSQSTFFLLLVNLHFFGRQVKLALSLSINTLFNEFAMVLITI